MTKEDIRKSEQEDPNKLKNKKKAIENSLLSANKT